MVADAAAVAGRVAADSAVGDRHRRDAFVGDVGDAAAVEAGRAAVAADGAVGDRQRRVALEAQLAMPPPPCSRRVAADSAVGDRQRRVSRRRRRVALMVADAAAAGYADCR